MGLERDPNDKTNALLNLEIIKNMPSVSRERVDVVTTSVVQTFNDQFHLNIDPADVLKGIVIIPTADKFEAFTGRSSHIIDKDNGQEAHCLGATVDGNVYLNVQSIKWFVDLNSMHPSVQARFVTNEELNVEALREFVDDELACVISHELVHWLASQKTPRISHEHEEGYAYLLGNFVMEQRGYQKPSHLLDAPLEYGSILSELRSKQFRETAQQVLTS